MRRFDPFGAPLVPGCLVRRYKRFLADVELADGSVVTAHCPNSGSMMGLREPGFQILLSPQDAPTRRLKWTWELVSPDAGRTWVGCNTMRPNQVVEHLLRLGLVPGFDASRGLRREVPYGQSSRIDLLLGDEASGLTYVEVKNATLERDGVACFPDAVTERGAKHMAELSRMVKIGHGAAVVFFVNRGDCDAFSVARDIDPVYGRAFDAAVRSGVRMVPLGMEVTAKGWKVRGVLPAVG